MKKPIISLLALLVSASVFSQALPAPVPRVVFPATVVGNVVTYGPMTADASNAAKFSFGAAANGSVFANTGTALATAGGSSVNLAVAGSITKVAALRAVGRFAVKTIPLLNTGAALYDLAKELGFTAKNDTGVLVVTKTAVAGSTCGTSPESISLLNQCNGSWAGPCNIALTPYDESKLPHQFCNVNSNTYGVYQAVSDWQTTPAGADAPSTVDDLISAANARATWPAGSSLGRAVADALASGESAAVEPVTVTGPATSPGTSSQTNTANDPATNSSPNPANNPNTSTTTQTQTNNHTYNGPSVTTTTTTTNTTVNNSTGAVTNNSTTTTAPVAPVPPAESVTCGLPGKPACKIDETGTPDPDPLIDGKKVAADAMAKLKDFGANPQAALPALPSLNWAFRLPTGCVPLQITAFAPFLQTIDICQFQPMFHDIMGMVWTIGGLFGAIGLFWRNTLSQS